MAYKDEYYNQVDEILDGIGKDNPYRTENDANATSYEEPNGQVQPVGWVENADSSDGEAKVLINADGITVLDGRISIQDSGGNSVLSSGGFDGAWTDFIETGIYNSHFAYGTEEDAAVSEVAGGEGSANYLDSLSDDIPYWVVAVKDTDIILRRLADTSAVGGYALEVLGPVAGQLEMYQDIPISSGQQWDVLFYWKYVADASNNFNLSVHSFWMDEDHTTISSALGSGLGYTTNQSTYTSTIVESLDTSVPSNARFLRLVLLFTFVRGNTGNPAARAIINGIRLAPKVNFGKQQFPNGVADIDADSVATDTLKATALVASVDANQNNWNPTGFSTGTVVVVTGLTATRTITGMIAKDVGSIVYILNQSGQSLVLAHESASSSAANRFSNPGAANLTIRTSGGVAVVYASDRWRVASP